MNRKTLFAFVAVGSLSTVCNAQSYWVGTSNGGWHDPNSWSPTGVPDSTTDVIIEGGKTYYPSLGAAASVHGITMENGALVTLNGYNLTVADADYLILEAGSLVSVNGSGDFILTAGGAAQIAGEVRLEASGSAMMINDTVELIGHSSNYGKIVGQHPSAQIQITDAETLVNGITIEGSLQVTSDDDLSYFVNKVLANNVNSGRVSAFSTNVLQFAVEVEVRDDRAPMVASDPLFEANAGRLVILNTWDNSLDYNFDSRFSVDTCGELWIGEGEYIYTALAMPSFSGTVRTDLGTPSSDDFFSDDNEFITDDVTTLDCD